MEVEDDQQDSETLEEGEAEVRKLTLDDRFELLRQDLDDSIDALRETHQELASSAARLDDLSTIWSSNQELANRLTDEDKAILDRIIDDIPDEGLSPGQLMETLWEAVHDRDWGPPFAIQMLHRVYRPRREPIFHNAMLISGVSATEAHLAKLAAEYYRAAPSALHEIPRESAKEFSLRDLQNMNSVDEAVDLAIESRVTQLMFGSLADWRKFFKDRMNTDMTDLCLAWDDIREIFERRHCIVHNEGTASRRYVAAIETAEIGGQLNSDAEYVRGAIDALELLSVLLHASVWNKFSQDKQRVIDSLEQSAFSALKAHRWEVSLALYEKWQELPLSEREQRMAKVNIWLAKKGITGLESVRPEIENWDVSGSDEVYVFAKACLLEDRDKAFEMLPDLIERAKIDGQSLASWPLTAILRQDTRIKNFNAIMQDYLSSKTAETDDT